MNDLTAMIADGYDKNDYNLHCRSREILQEDREFIECSFERMVQNAVGYCDTMTRKPRILDLGCGFGFPYTKELSKYGKVLGCDVSSRQVDCARLNVPKARFINKDVMDLHLRRKYDIVTMFHSFFNISPDNKPILLARMYYWLEDHGVVIITTYGNKTEVKTKEDFHGQPMIWHHTSTHDFEKLAIQAGFSIVLHESRNDTVGSQETHLWLLQKS